MPMLDLPLDKLHAYQGRNPKPADFDRYWQEALAELAAVPPRLELRPAPFSSPVVEAFDLSFDSTRGARIHGKLVRPRQAGATPLEIRFHGLGGNAGDWVSYVAMAASGFTVAGMDCRGQRGTSDNNGRTSGPSHTAYITCGMLQGPAHLYYKDIFLDAHRFASLCMAFDWIDRGKVAVSGGSQGGGLTLACAGLTPGLNRIIPVYPFLCDYRRVWEMDLAVNAYADIRDYLRTYDPRHQQTETLFQTLGYIDAQFLAERITARTLMHTGLMDNICPPSTQFAAFNRIKAEKNIIIYPDFGHENLTGMAEANYEFLTDML